MKDLQPAAVHRATRAVALLLALTFLVPLFSTPVWAAPTAESILRQMNQINPGLSDLKAQIKIDLKLLLNVPLTGAYYYKKPNKHKLVLNKNTLKNLFAKYPNIFGWDPPKAEDFNATVKSGQMLDGRRCFYLVLIPKQGMGDLLKEELWVDEEYYTLPQHKYYYKNNGFIHVRAQYMNSGGYMVFKSMSASVSFPKVNINTSVSATYSDYQFNLGLTDEFFQIPKR